MSELDKLEKYLLDHRITYERYEVHEEVDGPAGMTFEMGRHQICVPEEGEVCRWDAICQRGSFGYEAGLLEIYGEIVDEATDGDSVVGWLTAEDVIKRLEARR